MKAYLLIGVGGFLGANARFLVNVWAVRYLGTSLPWGTLLVNVTGSLVLGAFLAWSSDRMGLDPAYRLLLAVGFCGSYTTFSAYAVETFELFERGDLWLAAANIALHNVASLLAVIGGFALVRAL